jgi:hypothetical protein
MICFVNADVCEVSDCFDSHDYECTEFEWTALDNYSKTIDGDCIILRSKSIDFAGHTLNFTAYNGDGTGNQHFNVIKIVGSGSISNGIINLFSGGGPGLRDCPDIFVNQTTGSGSVVVDNMKINNQNVYSTSVARPFYAVSNVNPQLYITNTAFRNYDGSHPDGMIDLTKYNGSIFFVNSNITSLYASDTFGVVFGDYYALSMTSTKIQSFVNNLKFTTNTQPTLNSLFSCYSTTTDITSLYPFTISSSGIYSDVIVNMTIPNLNECWEFTEFENETEPAAYTHCTSPDYNDLSELGLYDLIMLGLKETTNTSAIDKYAFKIKIQNETLFNSINITSNKICLEKKGSYFRYCVDGVSQSSMYDAMSDNLEGYNYAQLLEFKGSMTGNWFIETFLKDIFIATDNQVISAAYCNQNNLNCGWLGCTCKGYKYEFNLDALESGDYAVYMELNTSTGCAYYLYLDSATLNGQLDEDLTTKFPGISDEPIPGGSNITVKKKLFFTGKFEGYLTGDLCNYTVYAKGVNGLKAADVLFYLTADTATNRYLEDEIIETKQASYDEVNDRYYAVFDVCSELYADVYKIGFFGRVRDTGLDEWVDLDNQGYIVTMNKSSNGSVNNFYYYIDNSTKIYYGVNDSVSSSDDANDKYFLPPWASGFSWYDILFWGIIIFFVIIVLWLIMGVLTRSPVKKFYGYSKR